MNTFNNQPNMNRRQFLKRAKHTGISTAALLGSAQLGAMSVASAQSAGEYKALVCVLLAGGADSFNMLVPTDNTYYAQYQRTRTDIALAQASLLSLANGENNGRTLGLHPQLAGLQALYNQGHLAFLSNVGTLVEPTTTDALASGSAKLPLGLYSHSDQISQWQTAVPDGRSGSGWGGRMADILSVQNTNQQISMSISAAGSNEFQVGRQTDSFNVLTAQNPTPSLVHQNGSFEDVDNAVQAMFSQGNYTNTLRRAYSKLFTKSLSSNAQFASALASAPTLNTQFAQDEFSSQLEVVAKTIAANQSLGMQRQTFFVTFGGWDHHDEVINNMNGMLKVLNDGLVAFQNAMVELNLQNQVTTFTTSDFARTLSSNGRGSDHGWGGNSFIMGGAVKGGSIYGQYPSLALNNPLDTGRGVLLPTTSVDEYFAELALWFGVSPSVLRDILPNIERFYSPGSSSAPLGFLL